MAEDTTKKEVEDLIALLFPNYFLERDMKKLVAIYTAGKIRGLQIAQLSANKYIPKTPTK